MWWLYSSSPSLALLSASFLRDHRADQNQTRTLWRALQELTGNNLDLLVEAHQQQCLVKSSSTKESCLGPAQTTSESGASLLGDTLLTVFSFSFSLFCFFTSFCCSVYLLDWLYEHHGNLLPRLWRPQYLPGGNSRLRPYSPTLVRLAHELELCFKNEDSRVTCLADQSLNAAEVAEVVLPMISQRKARRWKALDLSSNEISDEGLDRLFQVLLGEDCNCDLEEISLKRCGIETIVPSLLEYLTEPQSSLKEINLSSNKLGAGSVASLAQVLPRSNLQVLNLSHNDLTDDAIKLLCDYSWSSQQPLKELYLRGNRIMDGGLEAIAGSKGLLKSLSVLDLSGNPITDAGLKILGQGIRDCFAESPNRSQLELNVGASTIITSEGVRHLVSGMGLKSLNLSGIRHLGDDVFPFLVGHVRHSPSIRRICLFQNPDLDVEKVDGLYKLLRFTRSEGFFVSIQLLAVKDLPRVAQESGIRCHLGLLPKEIVRLVVCELLRGL